MWPYALIIANTVIAMLAGAYTFKALGDPEATKTVVLMFAFISATATGSALHIVNRG